jgi:hypothetical protein
LQVTTIRQVELKQSDHLLEPQRNLAYELKEPLVNFGSSAWRDESVRIKAKNARHSPLWRSFSTQSRGLLAASADSRIDQSFLYVKGVSNYLISRLK